MKSNKQKKLNPLKSLFISTFNRITFKIHFTKIFNGKILRMEDGTEFEIFRHVIVGNKMPLKKEKGSIFIVSFKLSKMSVEKKH